MSYLYSDRSNRVHDFRNYQIWNNQRGSTDQRLDRIPSITHSVDGKVRYYSAIDAELYYGDIYIDEVTQIAWSIQQQTMPLFGYNSYTFDDIAVGSRLIQGQFSINFTKRNWLTKLQNDSKFRNIARSRYREDTEVETIYSDYRKRLHLPIWDKGFDLVVGFGNLKSVPGDGDSSIYGTYIILDCVQVTGSQIELDYEGRPVQEVYSFIARDIKTSSVDTSEDNPSYNAYESVTPNSNLEIDTSKTNLEIEGQIDLTSNTQINVTSSQQVTFKQGNFQLSGTFNNKILQSVLSLEPTTNRLGLESSMSQEYLRAFESELYNKDYILATVKYKYVHESLTEEKKTDMDEESTITFKIRRI